MVVRPVLIAERGCGCVEERTCSWMPSSWMEIVETRTPGTSVMALRGAVGKCPRWRLGRRWRTRWRGRGGVVVVVLGGGMGMVAMEDEIGLSPDEEIYEREAQAVSLSSCASSLGAAVSI